MCVNRGFTGGGQSVTELLARGVTNQNRELRISVSQSEYSILKFRINQIYISRGIERFQAGETFFFNKPKFEQRSIPPLLLGVCDLPLNSR